MIFQHNSVKEKEKKGNDGWSENVKKQIPINSDDGGMFFSIFDPL
jgi:hypothetical protein